MFPRPTRGQRANHQGECTIRRGLRGGLIADSPQQAIHTFALQPGVSAALVAILVDLYFISNTNLGLMTMATYLCRFHWILIVIIPKRNLVIYLDSLQRANHIFTVVRQLING